MTEGTLARWRKRVGDQVQKGDVIAEVETDKATMDLESFDAGTLLAWLVEEGAQVAVNAPIAWIGKPGEKLEKTSQPSANSKAAEAKQKDSTQTQASSPASQSTGAARAAVSSSVASSAPPTGRMKASPLAKKMAAEHGVQLTAIQGSGPGGRILKSDILEAAKVLTSAVGSGGLSGGLASSSNFWAQGQGASVKDQEIPLSNMRRTIARRLLESKIQIPHFYLEVEIDASALLTARASLNKACTDTGKAVKLTVNDFILRASAIALQRVPVVNASFEGDKIRQHGGVHLSFAVAIPDGLITPVIFNAQNKTIVQLSLEAHALAEKAKKMGLKPEEYTGGTFTVSNLGMLGVDRFSAIINPPQAAILAVGSVVKKPVVGPNDTLIIGQRMTLTLSCDHRVVDGAVGATFLNQLKTVLEAPSLLLL